MQRDHLIYFFTKDSCKTWKERTDFLKKKRAIEKHKQCDLINLISDATGFTKADCKVVLDVLPECLCEILKNTNEDQDMEVSLTNGLIIGSRYIEGREMVDPRNQEPITVKSKLQPYSRFPRTFKKSLNP